MRIHPFLPYLQILGRSNQDWLSYADEKKVRVQGVPQSQTAVLPFQSQTDFFSIQGVVILRLMIQSVWDSNSSEISLMSSLSANFRKAFKNWMNHNGDKVRLFQQSRGGEWGWRNSKTNDPFWPVFKRFILTTFSASFGKFWLKLKELRW